jgi:transcriptional regulator with XRE-family HTH domain
MAPRVFHSILDFLEASDLTQAQLAARLNKSQPYISKVINRRQEPSLRDALRIARVCRVPLESLVIPERDITVTK